MTLSNGTDIEGALRAVGELLEAAGEAYAIVVLGGAALNLLGVVERATADVDILAFAPPGPALAVAGVGGASPSPDVTPDLRQPPEPLPSALVAAIDTVARDFGLDRRWMNTGPALQWRAGLPPGLATRVHWRVYAALRVGLVDRYDLTFFKLFASADATGPRSVHYQDLLALRPSPPELEAAAAWVHTQDAAPAFAEVLDRVVAHVRRDLGYAA